MTRSRSCAARAVGCGGRGTSAEPKATACGCRRSAPSSSPLYVTAPPGDQRPHVRRRAGRHDPGRRGRQEARAAVPRHPEPHHAGGEQGPAVDGVRARLRARAGCSTSTTPATNGDKRVVEYQPRERRRGRPGLARARCCSSAHPSPTTTAACCCSGRTGCSTSALGDGGGGGDQHGARGNGQNLGTLLGKILRIDPRASGARAVHGPVREPVRGAPGARPEIYAYGLRNPWRFSFDRQTGDLAIGDVGQDEVEEIDFVRKGRGAARTSAGACSRAAAATRRRRERARARSRR